MIPGPHNDCVLEAPGAREDVEEPLEEIISGFEGVKVAVRGLLLVFIPHVRVVLWVQDVRNARLVLKNQKQKCELGDNHPPCFFSPD